MNQEAVGAAEPLKNSKTNDLPYHITFIGLKSISFGKNYLID